jgi:hypothetical protein
MQLRRSMVLVLSALTGEPRPIGVLAPAVQFR